MPGPASPHSNGCHPARHLAPGVVAALSAMALTGPATAQRGRSHEALHRLIPLIQVFDARTASPEFDVAGIRCGALVMAQDQWARRNAGRGARAASPATLRSAENSLTAAETARRNRGMSAPDAYQSTLADLHRVIGLYTARFDTNAEGGSHPWNSDPLLHGDIAYCGHINR